MHYCPGCSHGVVHKLVAEVIDEMGMEEKTIGVAPVGCAVFAYNYIDIDWQEAAHGRAPAIATGNQTIESRQNGIHIPGRRRLGSHRYGRDYSRLQPG